MNIVRGFLVRRCGYCSGGPESAASEQAAPLQASAKPSILLVHRAFADALGWQKVTALLLERGYFVTARK